MFEYVKEKLNNEIDKIMLDYDKKVEEKENILYEINMFSDLKNIKNELITNKISFGFWVSLLIMMFVVTAISNINIIIGTLFVLLPSLKIAQYLGELSNIKSRYNEIEKKCLEVAKSILNFDKSTGLKLDKNVIEEVTDILNNKKNNIEGSINDIMENINKFDTNLKYFERCESDYELFSKGYMVCFKNAKNENELNELLEQCYISDNNKLDDYLKETLNYSNIHFDNSISKDINYTEDSKKLIKKM